VKSIGSKILTEQFNQLTAEPGLVGIAPG